jgi:hypothetical protein
MAMAVVIARTCRISRYAILCAAYSSVIVMHRDCVDRDRGVLARKVEIELQRLQPPRYSHARDKAYFRNRFVGILFCRGLRWPTAETLSAGAGVKCLSHYRTDSYAAIQLMESLLTA